MGERVARLVTGRLIDFLEFDDGFAIAGGGLTVIANAPNPAGVSLLRDGFNDESIGVGGLLLGALAPTVVAMLALFLL